MNEALVLNPTPGLRARLSTTLISLTVLASLWTVLGFAYRNYDLPPPYSIWDPTPVEPSSYHYTAIDEAGRPAEGWYIAPDRWLHRDFDSVFFSDGETTRFFFGGEKGFVYADHREPYAPGITSGDMLMNRFDLEREFQVLSNVGGDWKIERTKYLERWAYLVTINKPSPAGYWFQLVIEPKTQRVLSYEYRGIETKIHSVTHVSFDTFVPQEVFVFDLPEITKQ